jgi:hypothetical protein
MSQTANRKLTLADGMILVAMTAFGLSCYLLLDNALFSGQRYFFGLFGQPPGGWDSARVLDRAAAAVSALLLLFGGWTLALPVLRLRQPRPGWRRLNRQAGMTACIAAIAGMALCASIAGCAFLLHWWVDGTAQLPPNYWFRIPLFDDLVAATGLSVAVAWIIQALSGLWRPSADWVDRLGRSLGGLWIAAGLVFSIRLVMGP